MKLRKLAIFVLALVMALPLIASAETAYPETVKFAAIYGFTGSNATTANYNQEAIDYVVKTYFPEAKREDSSKPIGNRIYVPKWEKPTGSRIKLRPVYPRIPNGCRNICLTSLAGMLHNQGYSRDQIYDELIYCNTVACDPELPRGELQTIVNSVTRYKR